MSTRSHARGRTITTVLVLAFAVVSCDMSQEPPPVFEFVDECPDTGGCIAAVRYQGREYESTGTVSEAEVPADAAVPPDLQDMDRAVRVNATGDRLYLESGTADEWFRFTLRPGEDS